MKYTLDTDFSSLNGPKAANWIMGFQDMAEDAFADSNSHSRLFPENPSKNHGSPAGRRQGPVW